MISGKYDAKQAYQSFNTKLLKKKSDSEKIVLDSKKAYSNHFHTSGGNEAYPAGKNMVFNGEVKDTWTKYVLEGDAVLAKPEDYMTLR